MFSQALKARKADRKAFTLIELLVVIAIIGILVSLLLPAINKVREAANRTKCTNNLRQMGIALNAYHDANKFFPTSGELGNSISPLNGVNSKSTFAIHSTFTLLLPYLEQQELYEKIDLTVVYLSDAGYLSGGDSPFQKAVPTFLCPTNPVRPSNGLDAAGFGYVDYQSISYISINTSGVATDTVRFGFGSTGTQVKDGARVAGALAMKNDGGFYGTTAGGTQGAGPETIVASTTGSATGFNGSMFVKDGTGTLTSRPTPKAIGMVGPQANEIVDGTSNTIVMTEDVGRSEVFTTQKYAAPIADPTNANYRAGWRWGEPDSGNGLSGPDSDGAGVTFQTKSQKGINNNAIPFGGPSTCLWTVNNCGPNDEVFSFHNAGANCLFADGHVTFIRDDIDLLTFRRLMTPVEKIATGFIE